jgi:hypothetical protein
MVKRKTSQSETPAPRVTTAVTSDGIYEGSSLIPPPNKDTAAIYVSNKPVKVLNSDAIAAGFANAMKSAVSSHRSEGRPVYSIGSDNKIKKS